MIIQNKKLRSGQRGDIILSTEGGQPRKDLRPEIEQFGTSPDTSIISAIRAQAAVFWVLSQSYVY